MTVETIAPHPQDLPSDLIPIFEELSTTPFACSGIEQLPGDRVNSTYRAILSSPLPDGSKSVILKHTKEWKAPWLGIEIVAERCVTEQVVLTGKICPSIQENGFAVRAPRLHHFIQHSDTQIIEDLADTLTLPEFLRSSHGRGVSSDFGTSLGHALGVWLASFHSRTAEATALGSTPTLGPDMPARDVYFNLYKGILELHMKMKPHLFEGKEEILRQYVTEEAKREIQGRTGPIHGDLGARHVLIPSTAPHADKDTILAIIDWETTHIGCLNIDVGQLVGELCLVGSENLAASEWIIQGLADGYGALEDESVFHLAVFAGLHILMLLMTSKELDESKKEELVLFSRDLIVKGKLKDRSWVETTLLKYFLKKAQ